MEILPQFVAHFNQSKKSVELKNQNKDVQLFYRIDTNGKAHLYKQHNHELLNKKEVKLAQQIIRVLTRKH